MAHIFKILLVDISITVADICSDFFMGEQRGRRNFKDINPLMSSVFTGNFVWGGEAIW
jgi:hypothetical protein